MKRLLFALPLLLLVAGCERIRPRESDPLAASEAAANASPELKEYVLVSQRAWHFQSLSSSNRTISEQPRGSGVLHIESELSCPDRSHVKMTGAVNLERYLIGETQYERRDNGPWIKSTVKGGGPATVTCKWRERNASKKAPDEADAAMLLPMYLERRPDSPAITVIKGPVREYQGIQCQEFTIYGRHTYCFALGDKPYPIHMESKGTQMWTTNFDWDKPIAIEPPKM